MNKVYKVLIVVAMPLLLLVGPGYTKPASATGIGTPPPSAGNNCPNGSTQGQFITETQMVWGPPAVIKPCSWVDIVAYRNGPNDTGWVGWCQSLGGFPNITVNGVAMCFNWWDGPGNYTATFAPSLNYPSIIAISETQVVWGPAWRLVQGTPVVLMGERHNANDNAWVDWCSIYKLYASVSITNYGNIPMCFLYWP